jgi:hypothetical protein
MRRQSYATGQIVTVTHSSLTGPQTDDHFRVVRRYSMPNRAPFYHVRSLIDRGQRMVSEGELSSVMPSISGSPTEHSKIIQLFPQIVAFDLRARRGRSAEAHREATVVRRPYRWLN